MKVSILTEDIELVNTLNIGLKEELANREFELTDLDLDSTNFLEDEFIISFIITNLTAIAVSLFSTWLYEKIKDRAKRIKINDEESEIDPRKIELTINLIINREK